MMNSAKNIFQLKKTPALLLLVVFTGILTCTSQSRTVNSNPHQTYKNTIIKPNGADFLSYSPNHIKQYVFFGRDGEDIHKPSFFNNRNLEGAQIVYSWRQLENHKGAYNFGQIRKDLNFLRAKGKKLFIQIQDVTFDSTRIAVPKYITTDTIYHGGIVAQYSFTNNNEADFHNAGWSAIRWDKNVAHRFHELLKALGKEFDGKIEGINLQETSAEYGSTGKLYAKGFTPEKYLEAIKGNMLALRQSFTKSKVIQYANFMPGEDLPDHNKHYLSNVYDYAKEINVGVGGPDILVYRKGQMNNSYGLIRESAGKIPIAMAVQEGNYSTLNPQTARKVTIPEIYTFAKDYLRVDYIFWCKEEPYYTKKVIPFLKKLNKSKMNTH